MAAMLLGASACSGGNNTIPMASTAKQMRPAITVPLYNAVIHKAGTKVAAADLTQSVGSVTGSSSVDGSQASVAATDLSGATVATAALSDNGNGTTDVQATDALGEHHFAVLSVASIHEGVNNLPTGGTMTVDSNTGIAVAKVTGANGTAYQITTTPNGDGTATVEIVGSDGSD